MGPGIVPARYTVAAEAVANCLDQRDLEVDRVIPSIERLRDVALAVAAAVVWEAQQLDLAQKTLGKSETEVREALRAMMWSPDRSALS